MLLIQNERTDPYFNLALEEYLMDSLTEDCISLWRNEAVIVVGRNQNTLAEINADYVREHQIRVVRRMTGGGAVFHDVGNVNFTYIVQAGAGRFNDYAHFTSDIVAFLKTLGVEAELSGRNDLTTGGRKFSGNAQRMSGGKVLHHGTILYSADLSELAKALNVSRLKMESKGIRSVSSRVVNLADLIPDAPPVSEFKNRLESFLLSRYRGLRPRPLTPEETAAVEKLRGEKYATWEWNFGASPAYNYKNTRRFENCGIVEVRAHAENGVLRSVSITGDFFGARDVSSLEKRLCGVRHGRAAIEEALRGVDVGEYISGVTNGEFAGLFTES